MKTVLLTILTLTACAVVAVADDAKAPAAPKKNDVTLEYSYPQPPTEKPLQGAEAAPLPRVGSMEWLRRVDQRDRTLMAPWEARRLNAWRDGYSFVEPPPSGNDWSNR